MSRTAAQREQQHEQFLEKQSRVWDEFFPKLQAIRSFDQAAQLVASAVPEGSPGRKFYSNLGNFLMAFSPPGGASITELQEYIRLIAAFDEAGEIKPDARPGIEAGLKKAIYRDRAD